MLSAPFVSGVGIYAFYALQPYLLELWGDPNAYSIAGVAAAVIAGAMVIGGSLAPRIRLLFRRRTSALIITVLVGTGMLVLMGVTTSFWVALALLVLWSLIGAAEMPIRQAYLNDMIPSKQRATVLSFDSLMGSTGGVAIQPVLGRVADASGYALSFVIAGGIQLLAVPFLVASRRQRADADTTKSAAASPTAPSEN
jgi:MFS family permease